MFCQDPDAVAASFESWWEAHGEKFFNVGSESHAGEEVEADDLEFEELDEQDDEKEVEEEEVGENVAGASEDLTDLQKMQRLEDRSKVQKLVETMQGEKHEFVESESGEMQEAPTADEVPECEGVSVAKLLDELSALKEFDLTVPGNKTHTACLERFAAMKPKFLDIIAGVKILEGFLSKTVICGKDKQKNEWNDLMSELSRAKQYAKFRGLRSSRLAGWMQSQEELRASTVEKGLAQDGSEDSLLHVEACRPFSSTSSTQYVIYKSNEAMAEYHVGMVTSIYRGAVAKAKATDRRMGISKPLPLPAPASLISKVRVVRMQKLEEQTMVASSLSPHELIYMEDICGEIVAQEEGSKKGLLFASFPDASMKIWEGLANGSLTFGKDAAQKKRRKKAAEAEVDFQGFTIKSFPRGESGDAMIESLAHSLFGFRPFSGFKV